jgi:hypothetical protein
LGDQASFTLIQASRLMDDGPANPGFQIKHGRAHMLSIEIDGDHEPKSRVGTQQDLFTASRIVGTAGFLDPAFFDQFFSELGDCGRSQIRQAVDFDPGELPVPADECRDLCFVSFCHGFPPPRQVGHFRSRG